MSDLTDFLLARIAEDDAAARAAHAAASGTERWWVDGPAEHSGKHWVYQTGEKFTELVVAEHIARHDPARVLAECEAKRQIVEIHQLATADQGGGVGCMHCDWDREWGMPTTGGCDTLRALALPYADHPDHREEWRP